MIVEILTKVVDFMNDILWSYILMYGLIIVGLYFSITTKFVQFRLFGEMFRVMGEGVRATTGSGVQIKGISSFQAFCMSTASRVGTGNLAGVAGAIAIGGPGAIFWMWIIALVGAASAFVESTIAQVYKIKGEDGLFRGGPAYYMEKALGARWMGSIFAVLIVVCFGFAFNSIQSNTIAKSLSLYGVPNYAVCIAVTIITALVIFGGVKRVAKISQIIVPVMALIYVAGALIIIILNITAIPSIIKAIVMNAFGIDQVTGGVIGAAIASAMQQGVKRGLFSNEAGMGSAPNAAATAVTSHPVKQGLIQTLSVFSDTLIICSATAFIVILSGAYTIPGLEKIQIAQEAFKTYFGEAGLIFLTISIFLFCYSSIIGNYIYGESNIRFMARTNPELYVNIYRALVVVCVAGGSMIATGLAWDMGDVAMGLMAIVNMIAILLLWKTATLVLEDYTSQKAKGIKHPVFKASSIPGLSGAECWSESNYKQWQAATAEQSSYGEKQTA